MAFSIISNLVTVFGMMLFASMGLSIGLGQVLQEIVDFRHDVLSYRCYEVPEMLKASAAFKRMKEVIDRQPLVPL